MGLTVQEAAPGGRAWWKRERSFHCGNVLKGAAATRFHEATRVVSALRREGRDVGTVPSPWTADVVSPCLSIRVPADDGQQAGQLALQELFKETVCGSDKSPRWAAAPGLAGERLRQGPCGEHVPPTKGLSWTEMQ